MREIQRFFFLLVPIFQLLILQACSAQRNGQAQPKLTEAQTQSAAPDWIPPDPLELKEKEIKLLRRQNEQFKSQLEKERIGRVVYETQLQVAALRGFDVKAAVR